MSGPAPLAPGAEQKNEPLKPKTQIRRSSILGAVLIAEEPTRTLVFPEDKAVWSSNWRRFVSTQLMPYLLKPSPHHRIAVIVYGDTNRCGLLMSLGEADSLQMNLYISPIHIHAGYGFVDFAAAVSVEASDFDRAVQLMQFDFDEAFIFVLAPKADIVELKEVIDQFEMREHLVGTDAPLAFVIQRDGRWFELIGEERDSALSIFGPAEL